MLRGPVENPWVRTTFLLEERFRKQVTTASKSCVEEVPGFRIHFLADPEVLYLKRRL